jgi:excisionase family DNA binding protein
VSAPNREIDDLGGLHDRHGVNLGDRLAVSPRQTALLTGLSHTTVYQLINAGTLRSVKVGARRLIATSEIRRWLEESSGACVEGGDAR